MFSFIYSSIFLAEIQMANLSLAGASLGAGLIAFAAATGIGKIGEAAMNGIARQPEASNKIQTSMIIAAALIEGVSLFGALICLLIATK